MTEQRPFLCRMLGCAYDEYNVCVRCDLDVYEWPPHEEGWLGPLWHSVTLPVRKAFRPIVGRKCAVCHKRFWHQPYDTIIEDNVCSADCKDGWVPF